MKFADIPGQQALKETLISSYDRNHLAHAQLFSGNQGGAALSMALAYSSFLLCENKASNDACGTCPSCEKAAKGVHPDIHFFYPTSVPEKDKEKIRRKQAEAWRAFLVDNPYGTAAELAVALDTENKQNQISKEDARRIVKTVSMKSFEGGLKILIIWYPEKMHPSAANAILKVLEEPPENTIYFLVTHSYEDLLATILSRTQLVVVPTFSDQEVAQYLIDHHGIPGENAQKVSRLAAGSISQALNDLQSADDLAFHTFQDWMRACLGAKFDSLTNLSEDFNQLSKSKQRSLFQFSSELIRSAILSKGSPDLVTGDEAELSFIQKFGGAISLNGLSMVYDELNTTLRHLERNANPRITHLALSIRLSQIIRSNRE